MTQIQKRSLDIAKIEDKNDTTITTGTTEYSLETSNTNKIAVVGSYSGEIYSSDKTKSKDSSISKWELDKNGRAVSYIWNIYNPASDIGIYKYDAKGNLIEYEQKEFGYAEDRTLCKYKYDNNGQMIESDFYDSGVLLKITTFKYKSFDPNKNWTVQISYSKNHGPWASIDSSLNIDTMT